MRARLPDVEGHVERDGVRLGYEVHGDGRPTILLLPTWTIVHQRIWKLQVPFLARHHRVVTYDGPGNGTSDRVLDPARYSIDAEAEDAVAVLDATGSPDAVVVGVSMGGAYAARLAARHPDRVRAAVLIAPALALTPPLPERSRIRRRFDQPYPEEPQGWDRYNRAYWHDHYADFTEFFFGRAFHEPHSTKPREDAVAWASETTPAVLTAEAARPASDTSAERTLAAITCPVLVIHGTDDHVIPYATGVAAAERTGGELLSIAGGGHLPLVRDPVRIDLALHDFVRRVAS